MGFCLILSRHIRLHASFICTGNIFVFLNASISCKQEQWTADGHDAHVGKTQPMTTEWQLCIVFIFGTNGVILNDAVS